MRAFDIISSTPFRRLAAKQQVFGLIGDDHSRTRYSHSVETAEIGKRLLDALPAAARPAAGAEATLEAACLLHDIGMPPFGHKGEALIREWVVSERPRLSEFGEGPYQEYAGFDSNAQGLRLIYYHPQFETLRTPDAAHAVAAAMKYPWTRAASNAPKCGILASELARFRATAAEAGLRETRDGVFERHPLSHLVEVADDIAYLTADVEDAARLKVISSEEFEAAFLPFAPPGAGEAFESAGHGFWRFRRRLVDRLIGLFAEGAATASGPHALAHAAESFFAAPPLAELKARSVAYIYVRRDRLDTRSSDVMPWLLRDVFAEFAEAASSAPAVKEIAARFLGKRRALAARSTPLQLTVDLASEFTDGFAAELVERARAARGLPAGRRRADDVLMRD